MSNRFLSVIPAVAVLIAAACESSTGPEPLIPDLLVPWSEISGRIAYSDGYNLVLIDANRREVRRIYLSPDWIFDVALSYARDEVAVRQSAPNGTRVLVIDLADGSIKNVIWDAACPRWLYDGRLSYRINGTIRKLAGEESIVTASAAP